VNFRTKTFPQQIAAKHAISQDRDDAAQREHKAGQNRPAPEVMLRPQQGTQQDGLEGETQTPSFLGYV
jgi:hypothetical protein